MATTGNPQLSALWLGSDEDRRKAAATVLDALAAEGTVRKAAKRLRIGYGSLYAWLRTKPELRGWRETAAREFNARQAAPYGMESEGGT